MKLYYSNGACSLSPHIVLQELGIPYELEKVDLATHTTTSGKDFYTINPKGYVPALELSEGVYLTEGVAIVQYLADQKVEAGLIPQAGTMERYRLQEWLTFISSEVHKSFSGLFNKAITEDAKNATIERLNKRFAYIESSLQEGSYLLGAQFTVADAYLYTILRWSGMFAISLSAYPKITAYMAIVGARPKVKEALEQEGLSA